MVETTSEEQNKVKRKEITEDSQLLQGPLQFKEEEEGKKKEEEEKKKGYEKIFEQIIVENFPNMEKEIVNQVQKAERVPHWINPRRNTPRHILIKLTKIKYKERIFKAAREKQQVTYQGNSICLTTNLSVETLQAIREWQDIKI